MPDAESPGSPSAEPGVEPPIAAAATELAEGSPGVLRGAAQAAVLLAGAGLLGQVFTLVRELFVADKVGVSRGLDALLVAAVAPVMLAGLLASGPAAAIVPAYLGMSREAGRPAADRLLGATFTWTLLIGIVLTAVVAVGATIAVAITGPGLDAPTRTLAQGYIPLLAPILVFTATGSLLAAMFQIHNRMRPIAVAWVAGPAASVIVTVLLWDKLDLTALAIAMTAQQAVIVAVLSVVAGKVGILPRLGLRGDARASVKFVRHAMPLTISASVLQFNLLTDRAVATLIAPGAVSALRYAEGVIRIPMNAIVPAWTATIYPALVRASLVDGSHSFGEAANGALRYIVAIFVPLSVATAAMAPVIIELAYVRGAFDERAAILTGGALVGFAPLLVLTMIQAVLTGAHNARRRGVFLLTMGILNAILNAVFNVSLGFAIGVAGVALSTSLTMGAIQVIEAWRLGSIEKSFALGGLVVVSARSTIASLIVAAPIGLISWNMPHGLGTTFAFVLVTVLATAGMVGYVIVGRLIGLREPSIVAVTLLRSPLRLLPRGR